MPWRPVLIGILLLVVYYRVLGKLILDWWQFPEFSHGFLVPPFAAYLVWRKRESIAKVTRVSAPMGIVVVAMGLLTLLAGEFGVDLFLSRISLLFVLSGLVLSWGGWRLMREMRFALLVLLLAIPIPALIFNQIAMPLQTVASRTASFLLPVFGVPVLRHGNVIQLPSMSLEVAEACSGIRSLMSLFAFSIMFGYLMEKSVVRRTVLAVLSFPIAIAANAARILGTGLCVQYWDPEKALGFFHEFSGWVMFLLSIGCLYLAHRGICLILRNRETS